MTTTTTSYDSSSIHSSPPPSCGGSELEAIRTRARRKLRASVECINFVHLFQERIDLRRKFRAAVYCIQLTNSWKQRIYLRRKFRGTIQTIALSQALVNRPLGEKFDLETFQKAVHLMTAVNRLQERTEVSLSIPPREQSSPDYVREHHDEETLRSGLNKLAYAVERVRHGDVPQHHSDPAFQAGMQRLAWAVERVRHRGNDLSSSPSPSARTKTKETKGSTALQSGMHKLAEAVDQLLHHQNFPSAAKEKEEEEQQETARRAKSIPCPIPKAE